MSRQSRFVNEETLFALNVSDGSTLWSKDFGSKSSIGQPAVFDGAVYLANGKGLSGEAPLFWSLDAATGDTNWVSPLSAQWEQYWSPIVVNGMAYTNAGYYGGLFGVSIATGDSAFTQLNLEQYDEWSPAYFKGGLYTFIAGALRQHDPVTGAILRTTNVTWHWAGWSMKTVPVFGPNLAYVVAPPTLYAIDPDKGVVVWSAGGGYAGTVATVDGAVYGLSSGNLIVRDADSGALKRTFVAGSNLAFPPVVANGFVYVASDTRTFAINIATGAEAASVDRGGWLAIADHRLLVASSDGSLSAYLLTQTP